jgi:hypothetical protein
VPGQAWELKEMFKKFKVEQISREQNCRANQLAQLASALEADLRKTSPIEFLKKPAIAHSKKRKQVNQAYKE